MWIQEGFTAEPPRNHSGVNFSDTIRVSAPKSVGVTGQKLESQTKSQSYSRGEPQNPNRIAQKRAPNGIWVLLQNKKPLKAFLNCLCVFPFPAYHENDAPKLRHGTHCIWNLARQAVAADIDAQEALHGSHCAWNLAKKAIRCGQMLLTTRQRGHCLWNLARQFVEPDV